MKLLITNTENYLEELPLEYKTKLVLNNINIEEKEIDGDIYTYIELNTIEELFKLRDIIGKELIITHIGEWFKIIDKTAIEIYDDYRE